VESAPALRLFAGPRHPYTASLLSAVPVADPFRKRSRIRLAGDVPSPVNIPAGCSFHPRCPQVQPLCGKEIPELTEIEPGQQVACHFPLEKQADLRGPDAKPLTI
jgi:oligopeptide/dipeptide ABC transporter ATP-binding protein